MCSLILCASMTCINRHVLIVCTQVNLYLSVFVMSIQKQNGFERDRNTYSGSCRASWPHGWPNCAVHCLPLNTAVGGEHAPHTHTAHGRSRGSLPPTGAVRQLHGRGNLGSLAQGQGPRRPSSPAAPPGQRREAGAGSCRGRSCGLYRGAGPGEHARACADGTDTLGGCRTQPSCGRRPAARKPAGGMGAGDVGDQRQAVLPQHSHRESPLQSAWAHQKWGCTPPPCGPGTRVSFCRLTHSAASRPAEGIIVDDAECPRCSGRRGREAEAGRIHSTEEVKGCAQLLCGQKRLSGADTRRCAHITPRSHRKAQDNGGPRTLGPGGHRSR